VARNVLLVSIIDGKTHLLTLKRNIKIYHISGQPIFNADRETLEEKCRKSHEISVISDFPNANHYWDYFPKVPLRDLKEVVVRDAADKYGYLAQVRAVFEGVGEGFREGTPKRLLSCLVVDNADVFRIENEVFRNHRHKIVRIDSVPAVLAAVVSHVEKPASDFMVIDVGETSTSICISSPKGHVKISRQIPVGFGKDIKESDSNYAALCVNFFHEVAKDVTSTNLYYMQKFLDSECNVRYMLGPPALKRALESHGKDIPPVRFGFTKSPLSFMNLEQAATCAHLIGALFCSSSYNLLSTHIRVARNVDRAYRVAIASVGAAIIGSGFYLYQIQPVPEKKIAAYNAKNAELATVQEEVLALRKQVATLNRFSGWETFYKNTYQNQPAWNVMFSEVASSLPKEIVIESVRIEPGTVKDTTGKDVQGWTCAIAGVIKVNEWDKGLQKLREFGKKIHGSPNFAIQTVKYEPELDKDKHPTQETSFSFQINAQLTPQDTRK
jgi:hypothetical protein